MIPSASFVVLPEHTPASERPARHPPLTVPSTVPDESINAGRRNAITSLPSPSRALPSAWPRELPSSRARLRCRCLLCRRSAGRRYFLRCRFGRDLCWRLPGRRCRRPGGCSLCLGGRGLWRARPWPVLLSQRVLPAFATAALGRRCLCPGRSGLRQQQVLLSSSRLQPSPPLLLLVLSLPVSWTPALWMTA